MIIDIGTSLPFLLEKITFMGYVCIIITRELIEGANAIIKQTGLLKAKSRKSHLTPFQKLTA